MADSEMEVFYIPNVEGFTATNVLSREECAELRTAAEASGFKWSGEDGGPIFAGERTRTTFTDKALSDRLFTRLKQFLMPLHHNNEWGNFDFVGCESGTGCYIPSGRYVPTGVNDLIRVSKYLPYGSFLLHRDTGYLRDDQYVGFWTLLVYFNDDFEGGETNIYNDNGILAHTVKPEVGKVFAFYHYHIHEGLKIKSGSKLVARTEIMFALEK